MLTIRVCSHTSEITALFHSLIGFPDSLIISIPAFSATGKAPAMATAIVLYLSLECCAETRGFLENCKLEEL